MPKIICCANQKGGVGKTTTAINMGCGLARKGKRVLLIDCDPQANLTSGLGIFEPDHTIYDVVRGRPLESTIVQTLDEVDLVPSGIDFAGTGVEFQESDSQTTQIKQAISSARLDKYEYIILDAPPSLDLITINCLIASTNILIPLQCEYFALEGLSQLMNSIEAIIEAQGVMLNVYGILFTMYDKRTRIAGEVVREVVSAFKEFVFDTIIPRNITLAEAPSHGKSIFSYDPQSIGAKSYANLVEEIVNR